MSKKKRKSNSNNDNLGTKKTQKVSKMTKHMPSVKRKATRPRRFRHVKPAIISYEESHFMGVPITIIRIRPPKGGKPS